MKNKLLKHVMMLVFLSFGLIWASNNAFAQINDQSRQQPTKEKNISGVVLDDKGSSVPGASIVIEGTFNGVITESDGSFHITVPEESNIVISFIGYQTQKIHIGSGSVYNITLSPVISELDALVVVGFGTQKKSTLIGAVTQTGNKELGQTGGVTNLAQAMTGNLPGVTIIQSQGQPGADDPSIFIRGRSTWNDNSPYILVDGVERRMNDIDINEVESISVLKDASATAVYGVKGANGVILITTKRGKSGKPQVTFSANMTMKVPSKLIDKLDAYDAITLRDAAIAKEAVVNPASWNDYVSYAIRDRYRNQANLRYPEAYPNVDWQDLLMKDFAMDYRANISVTGGNDLVKYFTSASYLYEGDLINSNTDLYSKTWKPGYNNNRFNFRSNVDINVTKTTLLTVNLAAIYTELQQPYEGQTSFNGMILNALYTTPPDIYLPQYSNGLWGYSPTAAGGTYYNPVQFLTSQGFDKIKNTNVTSDFVVNQKLDFVTKGLSAMVKCSFDNTFQSKQAHNPGYRLSAYYLYPEIEDASYLPNFNPDDYGRTLDAATITYYDIPLSPWKLANETDDATKTMRHLYYQFQINYNRSFGKHNMGGTGVFTREQMAQGSEFLHYREDWIFRGTYNYDSRYMLEFNGAYNGSEKFDKGNRFAFFPSIGFGWAVNNESFLKNQRWLDLLKFRYSYGKIGDDNVNIPRWSYMSGYQISPQGSIPAMNDLFNNRSPYAVYQQSSIGNPNLHWETAEKSNAGLDISVQNGLFTLSADYFTEHRTDIIIPGDSRILPIYYSVYIPSANVGKVDKKGYEIVFGFRKRFHEDWNVWSTLAVTHVKDDVIDKEEAALKSRNLLAKGYAINQVKAPISDGFMKNWDEIYASPVYSVADQAKMPGDFRIIDFDADGVYDETKDIAPYGYSDIPQNTYTTTLGLDYKGFSLMLQFYGVNNVTRDVTRTNFIQNMDIAYSYAQDYWSPDNPTGTSFLPRWKAAGNGSTMTANYFKVDGSYVRLKNAEIAYTFNEKIVKKIGMSGCRVYVNGNNLIFWSKKLPDDRETGTGLAYPNMKRFNFGIDIKF